MMMHSRKMHQNKESRTVVRSKVMSIYTLRPRSRRKESSSLQLLLFLLSLACCSTWALRISPGDGMARPTQSARVREVLLHQRTLGQWQRHQSTFESRCSTAHQRASRLLLFSSSTNNNNTSENKSPNKKLHPLILRIRLILLAIRNLPPKLKASYDRLSKRAKLILSFQLVVVASLLGWGIRSGVIYRKVAVNKPVEVPYSTFLDLAEVNGKGHVPGKHPALQLSNVVISKEKIGFTLQTDPEKHELALKDRKIQPNDVSVQLTSKRLYTVKPSASQDLMDTLRDNRIPFRAASAKGVTAAGNIARFGIIMMYILFLRRMYQVMGGGQGGNTSGPGKLATFNSNEPLVKFEDIEGIDDAKFEVMELVDTLRNPKKYEVCF